MGNEQAVYKKSGDNVYTIKSYHYYFINFRWHIIDQKVQKGRGESKYEKKAHDGLYGNSPGNIILKRKMNV